MLIAQTFVEDVSTRSGLGCSWYTVSVRVASGHVENAGKARGVCHRVVGIWLWQGLFFSN